MDAITIQAVRSSNVAGLAYRDEAKTLYVQFKSGDVYAYRNVGAELVNELRQAESMGRFVQQRLAGDRAAHPVSKLDAAALVEMGITPLVVETEVGE